MEPRFETLFQQAPFSLQLLGVDGRTLRVNKAWETLWNLADGDGMKEYVLREYNVLHDPQLEASGVAAGLRRAFAGESVELPTIYYDPAKLGKTGRARWVRAFAHPVKSGDGTVREVMLIHEDVTERRAADERLRLALLAGNIGIWEWDLDRDVVTWSEEVYSLHGLPRDAFGGTSQHFAALVHPDDRADMWSKVEAAIAKGQGFSADFRVVLPDGTIRWLSTWAQLHDGGGSGRHMIGATLTIDAYKRAETALRDADRRKDEFLAMLAHELRNPLAPISAAAQLLKLGMDDPATVRKASEVIGRQLGHITKLVDDLLDVSRVTRGLIRLEHARVDLADVVAGAVEQCQALIESKQHRLTVSSERGRTFVDGDRDRLVQIVTNLMNNAARYTPAGGRIEVAVEAAGDEALVRVTDTGKGMSPELLPRVFDLFTQGPRSTHEIQGGLGVGLALVRRLVELHGGRVEARSVGEGKGSVFLVRLPLYGRPG